jgi:hypothetical protein
MENFWAIFPRYGKLFRDFSTVWKTFSGFFHGVENFRRIAVRAAGRHKKRAARRPLLGSSL